MENPNLETWAITTREAGIRMPLLNAFIDETKVPVDSKRGGGGIFKSRGESLPLITITIFPVQSGSTTFCSGDYVVFVGK